MKTISLLMILVAAATATNLLLPLVSGFMPSIPLSFHPHLPFSHLSSSFL